MREQLGERVLRRELRCDVVPGKLLELCVTVLPRPGGCESICPTTRVHTTHADLCHETIHRLGRAYWKLGWVVFVVRGDKRETLRSQGGERDSARVCIKHDCTPPVRHELGYTKFKGLRYEGTYVR